MDPVRISQESPAQSWARALTNIAKLRQRPWVTLPSLIDEWAITHAGRPALCSNAGDMRYDGLARRKCQVARWAISHGLGPGSTVGLLMEAGPEYIAAWLGLTQTGAVVALLNTSLPGQALVHAVTCSGVLHLIVDQVHEPAVQGVLTQLPPGLAIYVHGPGPGRFGSAALDYGRHSGACLSAEECAPVRAADLALLVFTSGTTGLPKAARISHYRVLEWSFWFAGMMNTGPADCLYDCLPLFHSTGGIAAVGGVLASGGRVVLRPRFSARRFWDDVTDQGCTIFLYIGELCRYLAAQEPHPKEAAHQLRLCCGNGLREDVWRMFQARFAIPRILEFYASTEGNVSLYNCEGKPGAVGRIPAILRHRFPVAVVACDPESGIVARHEDGTCRRCAPDETGEAIGLITAQDSTEPGGFDGYTDADATEGKILRNVFKPGDAWFRTGDLMRQDSAGYFTFVDRLGDTFRWKGENVATTQVAGILSGYAGVIDAVVYGVAVQGEEGRAGMAALVIAPSFDLAGLPGFLAGHLPLYARPLFVRICASLATTATFKPVKAGLMRQGADPAQIADPLFRLDRAGLRYAPWTEVKDVLV